MPSWPPELGADIRRDCAEADCDREPTWHCERCHRALCAYHKPEDTELCAACDARFAQVWARRARRVKPIVLLVLVPFVALAFAVWGAWGLRAMKWVMIVIAPIIIAFTARAYRRKRAAFIDGEDDRR